MSQFEPVDDIKESAARIVRMLMEDRKWSASKVARTVGVAPSTITRIISTDPAFVPSNATLQKLWKVARDQIKDLDREVAETHLEIDRQISNVSRVKFGRLPIVATVEAGAWISQKKIDEKTYDDDISIIDGDWGARSILAVRCNDEHRSENIISGDYLLLDSRPVADDGVEGDIWVVQRRARLQGTTLLEIALWRAFIGPQGSLALLKMSDDEDDAALLAAPSMEDIQAEVPTSDDIDYIGKVVSIYRRLEKRSP